LEFWRNIGGLEEKLGNWSFWWKLVDFGGDSWRNVEDFISVP
jgi:hypothetical protein